MIWTSLIAQGKRRLWMSLFVSLLIALVYLNFARFYQGRGASWLFTIGWVPVGLNVLRAGLGLAYRLDRQPFRALDFGLEEDHAPPGGSFEIELRVEARRPLTLERLAAVLECTRHEIKDGQRNSSVLYREESVLASGDVLQKGATRTYRASLDLPDNVPYSFRSMQGKIRWALHLRAAVEDWDELRDEIELTVAPG
jgi:hypothetical protein